MFTIQGQITKHHIVIKSWNIFLKFVKPRLLLAATGTIYADVYLEMHS